MSMKMSTVLKTMIFVTLISLGYVHLQMTIIDLAYQGKSREKQIRNLIEENGEVTYNILTLKSSINLGGHMLDENMKMKFADPNSVVTMPASPDVFEEDTLTPTEVAHSEEDKINIFRLLSLGASAEARVNR